LDGETNSRENVSGDKVERLIEDINALEEKLHGNEVEIREVKAQLGYVVRLLELIYGIELVAKEVANKQMAELVMESLIDGPKNISQITETIREKRGKASRSIVAKTLSELREKGLVELVSEREKEKVYGLRKRE